MSRPIRYPKQFNDSHNDTIPPSNNLWVGNLSTDATESDLTDLFSKHGAIDSVTAYSTRNYAFVFFKHLDNAKAAKEALQGAMLRGSSIKIEFTRPAKPCKILWIGGISQCVSKEKLEEEVRKFGKIEDFRFLRDRNTASVEYVRLEDASEALRNLRGKRFGGAEIRVDFLRSQPSRKEQWNNTNDPEDFNVPGRGPPSDVHFGLKRGNSHASGIQEGDNQPSNVLRVGYPPSVQIDEQMLHNAMILFGEIEKIESYPSRHYAFVEFRSSDEAWRAKEGLQGRLFNDPRITIMFSSNDAAAPNRDYPGLSYPGINGPRPDMFFNEHSHRPPHMDMFGYGHPNPSNSFSGPLAPRPMSFGPQNGLSEPEHGDMTTLPGWRRQSSPHMNIHPSSHAIRPPTRPRSGLHDLYDERDPKRSRVENGMGYDHGKVHHSPPVGSKVRGGDYIWRGVIAKGGTPVCQARCIPLGKEIEMKLPEIVNCSARTGLDMLTKHFAEAIGFDIVFFMPDSESDFASYTEFLRYLAAKDRAGVAKFDDGSTLFLVPPSNFLTKVLKVTGPERLYGVVLKLPQQIPSPQKSNHDSALSQYTDRRPIPSPHPREENFVPAEYSRGLHDGSQFLAKPHFPPPSESVQSESVTQEYTPSSNLNSVSQTGVKLTPELIASLSSFLPGNTMSSSLEGIRPPPVPQLPAPNRGWNQDHHQTSEPAGGSFQNKFGSQFNSQTQQGGWNQDHHQASEPAGSALQNKYGNQFNPQTVPPQIQHYSSATHTQFQDFTGQGTPQNAHYAPSQPTNQLYQSEIPQNAQKFSNGVSHGTDSSGSLYNPFYQSSAPSMPNQVYNGNSNQAQNIVPSSAERVSNQVQQPQPVLSGACQGVPVEEVEKNQRYQSTLQFAANLLLQIQQKQQSNTAAGQGSGNQL
ncbi:hypothetical protein ACFE04_004374 [Oxalis oulophora]